MKRFFVLLALVLCLFPMVKAQDPNNYPPDNTTVVIDSTNLPIVWIDVDGATIMRDERIGGRMKIIHNGKGRLNYADTVAHPGQTVDYEGYIALRYRGYSSYKQSDKKPYSFRTLSQPYDSVYDKKKVKILGMGKDNDWALLAPFFDKSMIRDLLGFEIASPWMEYTPQGRYCELFLDGTYYGVYILSEVVSKGKQRLNLDDPGDSGDAITGGYLMEVGRGEDMYIVSKYNPVDNNGQPYRDRYILFEHKEPDYEDLTWPQIEYIKGAITRMEDAFASSNFMDPENGYRKYIDVQSFMDYQLVEEVSHNVDAYRLSGKFFKRRDSIEYIKGAITRMEDAFASSNFMDPENGYRKYIDVQSFMDYQLVEEVSHNVDAYRLSGKFFKRRDSIDQRFKMVVWDLNLAFGNARYSDGDTWVHSLNPIFYSQRGQMIPFWWYKLNSDPEYTAALKARWAQYRRSNLRLDRIMATIDSLANEVTCCGAVDRNSEAWPRWGVSVWPNYVVTNGYEEEITYLKQWLTHRIAWMDTQLGFDPNTNERGDVNGDGNVDVTDLTLLIGYVLSDDATDIDLDAADCNLDGTRNISDVTRLIAYILDGTWVY